MQRPLEVSLPEVWPVDVEKLFQSLVRKHALQFDLVAQDLRQAAVDGRFPSLAELCINSGDFTTESCRAHFASTKRSRNVRNPSRNSAKKIFEDNTTKTHTSSQTLPTSPSKSNAVAATSPLRSSLLSLSTNNDDFNILRDTSLNTIISEVHASLPNSIEAAVRVHADSAATLASRAYMEGNSGENEAIILNHLSRSEMTVRGYNAGNTGVAPIDDTIKASEEQHTPEFEGYGRGISGSQREIAGGRGPEHVCDGTSPNSATNTSTTTTTSTDTSSSMGIDCADDGEMVQQSNIASPTVNLHHTVNDYSREEGFNPTTMDISAYTSAVLQHILREDDKYDELWRHVQYAVNEEGGLVVDMSNQHLVRRKYHGDEEEEEDVEDDIVDNNDDTNGDGANGHRNEEKGKNKGNDPHNNGTVSRGLKRTGDNVTRPSDNNNKLSDDNVDGSVNNYHARYITSSRSLATARALVDYLDTRKEEEDEDTRAARELDRLLDMEMEYFQ